MKNRGTTLFLVLALSAFAPLPTHAALLVYENYDGYATGALTGKAATGLGLTGDYSGSTSYLVTAPGSGLLFSSLSTDASGRALSVSTTSGISSAVALGPGISVTGTLYTSYLLQLTTAGTTGTFSEARVADTAGANGSASRFRTLGEGRSSTAGIVGVGYNSTDNVVGTGALATGTTYLIIGRYDNLGTSGQTGTGTVWALSAAQYDFFNLDNVITDAELDGAAVGTGVGNVTSKATHTATTSLSNTFETGDFLQIATLGGGGNPQVAVHDELRYGTSLADVTAIPEPSSLLVLGSVAGLLVWRRRK